MGSPLTVIDRISAAFRADSWENTILGLGGVKDPTSTTTFGRRAVLSDEVLEALYVEDHFAAKIVESLPRDGMRPGWDLTTGGDPTEAAKLRAAYADAEESLEVATEMGQGAAWGRLFGGAITWIGANDGRSQQLPIREDEIETINFLHTFDRRDVYVWRVYQDPRHPRFQEPEIYRVQPQSVAAQGGGGIALPGGAFIHASRVVVWPGQPTTDRRKVELLGWDDSVLERCWDALRQVGEDYGAKSLLLSRISQGIYKIKKFYEMIAGGLEATLRTRMSLIDASRSRSRSILLDIDEDFVNVTQPLGGIREMLDAGILRLAAAGCMPVAILLGQPLASLEGTGEGDLEVWTTAVDAWRRLVLAEKHARIARYIMLAKDGPTGGELPEEWSISYRSLRIASPKEEAEIRKMEAETDAIRVDKGFANPEAIALQRFAASADSDLVLDEAEMKANIARRKELAMTPPKDNAELGTVAPRSADIRDTVADVNSGRIARESGKAILEDVHRFPSKSADKLLGPAGFKSTGGPVPTPGPDPDPQMGQGAGAPQNMPKTGDRAPDKPGEPFVDPEAKDPTAALNGAQVTALKGIVTDTMAGVLPKPTAIKLIVASFPMDAAAATDLLAEAEAGTMPAPDETRADRIEQRGEVWVVLSKAGKVLGEHETEEAAHEQLAAVEASKAREA